MRRVLGAAGDPISWHRRKSDVEPTKGFKPLTPAYSSFRTVYNLAGAGAWLYKYYFKAGMTKGIYTFYAFVPASPGFLYSRSPNLTIRLR